MKFKVRKQFIVNKIYWLGLLGVASTQALSMNPCLAQSSNIVIDDSLGNETSQIEKNTQLKGLPVEIIRGGAQRGINLFHSFREFNISEGRGAYFFSPNAEIQNILTRVTGSNGSEILGTLGTFGNSQPNLFLINPNGILFGEKASLNMQGSFVGTTANGMQFGERGVFSATNPEAPALLSVNPSAFFFNQINAQASIQNNSAVPTQQNPVSVEASGLRVPDSKSLLLLGGNINMDGGGLNAYGGRIELGGLTEPGTVALDVDGDNFRLRFPENVERGDVLLTNQAGIYVAADGGGDIVVNVQNLEMTGESDIFAGIGSELSSDNSRAGNIDINASQKVNLNNSFIRNDVEAELRGQGGNTNVVTNILFTQGGARVSANTFGKGKGGNLNVKAQDIQLIGTNENGNFTGLFAAAYATGDGGKLNLSTDKLLVQDGTQVSTNNFGEGKGGDLTVQAQDVRLIGANKYRNFVSGLTTSTYGKGGGGNLTLSADKLLIQDGSQVITATFGEGKGGNLTITARNVQLIGKASQFPGQFSSGLTTSTYGKGDGGNLTLSTDKLLVQDGGKVSSDNYGKGKAGDLIVQAQDIRLIGGDDGTTGLSARTIRTYSSAGDGGNIILSTDKLLVQDGAKVSTDTTGKGNGGDLIIKAHDVQLIGRTENGKFPSGLSAAGNNRSTGDGGNLNLSTNKLLVQDKAIVSTAAFGQGKGGNLIINADNLQLKDYALITAQSTEFGISDLVIVENTENNVKGISGNIEINVKDNFNADNGRVITQSQQSEGGNIKITAGKNIILRNDSNIRTTLESTEGSGGNINLTANAIVALEDSDILTFAPEGSGGNINFNTRAFFSNPLYRPTPQTAGKEALDALDDNNRVDVNASGSISTGNIIGIPDISFLQDNLTDLPKNQIDTNVLIANSCIARSNKRQENSFTITGSGGLRNNPVNGFVSKFYTGDVRNVEQVSRSWKKGDAIVEPTGAYKLADGRLMLGRVCK